MEIVEGNILDFPEGIEVAFQQCNIWACMGSGLAKQVRKRYPEAFNVDRDYTIEVGPQRFGNYSIAKIEVVDPDYIFYKNSVSRYIVNLYGQDLGKENPLNVKAYMSALDKSLRHLKMRPEFRSGLIPKLGFPYLIASGLAKGYWPYIKEITEWFVYKHGYEAIWVKYNGEEE